MTRGIFDPTGGETERSGSRYLPPQADNISHMPPDVVDGRDDEDAADLASPEATPAQDEAGAIPETSDPDAPPA